MRFALSLLAALSLAGAAPSSQAWAQAYKAPKNAFGQPDLSGVWTNASLTSLVRPAQFKSLTISEEQAKAVEAARARANAAQSRPTDPNAGAPRAGQDPEDPADGSIDLVAWQGETDGQSGQT